jgi:hypothetical protein
LNTESSTLMGASTTREWLDIDAGIRRFPDHLAKAWAASLLLVLIALARHVSVQIIAGRSLRR